ncbi:MAG: lysophospholipid acyltransferase family protein [Paludibacter sp.]
MVHIFYAFIWLLSWLPLPVLYLLSDFVLYPVVYYLVRYRKKVARENLRNSFPEKTTKELRKIERDFYHYFSDLLIEIMYMMHISEREMSRRFIPVNINVVLEQYAQGKSVMGMTAHYGNWEWASCYSMYLPEESPVYNIFKKLTNKNFGKLMNGWRTRFGGKTVDMKNLLRLMVRLKKEEKNATFGMISDQTPLRSHIQHWTKFLNQETPVIVGTEQLARKFDYPVFYFHINRLKRGYYECEIYPIALSPLETSEFEITDRYTQMLEEKIKEHPEFWLWTHKRWKHKRNPEN